MSDTIPRQPTGDDAVTLAHALDSFFYDLRYTAPEAWPERITQLDSRIRPTMAELGFPKKGR